jgi:hypothetical protein
MEQNIPSPLEIPPAISQITPHTTCESTSEYIDDPSSTVQNIPVIEGIPQDKLPATYKFIPDPVKRTITRSEDDSIITEYQYYNELKQEARLQYTSGRGLDWELAISKLQDYFLHPVDLTEAEFIEFVSEQDIEAWLAQHCLEIAHRVISRRAEAQQLLRELGISCNQLGGIEMFELMNDAERMTFIEEYRCRRVCLASELESAARLGIFSHPSTPVHLEHSEAEEEQLEKSRILEKKLSQWSLRERPASRKLRKRPSVFGSLSTAFRQARKASNGSTGTAYASGKIGSLGRSKRFSKRLGKSVSTVRHIFGQKRLVFRRARLGDDVYVRNHT